MHEPLTRIDPALPVCWESPDTLRLGFDRAEARVVQPSAATQRLLSMLRRGVPLRSLTRAAGIAGATPAERRLLVEQLAPVLITDTWSPDAGAQAPPTGTRAAPRVAAIGGGAAAGGLLNAAVRAGCAPTPPPDRASDDAALAHTDLAIVIERFLGAPTELHRVQVAGVPHLVVRFTDRSVRVGPVLTADGPVCHSCLTMHAVAADPALPALATQLLGHTPAAETAAVIEAAGALAAGMLQHWWNDDAWVLTTQLRLAVTDGLPAPVPERVSVERHEECGCALFRDHPGC